jgi:hypothetical protein
MAVWLGCREATWGRHRALRTPLYLPGQDRKREYERLKRSFEHQFAYVGPFFEGTLVPVGARVTEEMLIDSEVALVGGPDELVELIMQTKELCGYTDFMFAGLFEKAGFA